MQSVTQVIGGQGVVLSPRQQFVERSGGERIVVKEEIDIVEEICVLTGKRQASRPGLGNSCEWMFGDAASGLLGFNALAGLNPLRWSGETTFNKAITDLRMVQRHNDRPIILKVPANTLGQEQYFRTTQEAIDHLLRLYQALRGGATGVAMPATVIKAGVAQPTVANPRLSYMTEKICKEITAEFSGREVHDMWSNCGTVQEVPFIVERDIVVEVPEVHIIKVVNETPVYEEVDICTEVLVPEVIHKEVILEMHVEGTEIVEKPVNQWTIRETEKPAVVTRVIEECELLVDVPIVVPTVERVIERPIVTVDCKVHQVTGCVEKIVGETEVVEDRYVVDVPKVVPVPVEKIIIEPVEKVVQHIRRIEKIVEVPQEQTFQKIVEVPQINTKTTIRHVPKFVDNGYRSVMTKTAEDCAEEELHTARFLIQELELQKAQLRCQLELRQRQIAESDVTIECELRTRRQLEEQLERISGCFGREFKYCGEIVSPGNCTTIIKDVIVETVTVDVDPRRQTVVTEEDKIVVQTYGISGNPQGATNCEWMFGDAATGLLGFNALAGLNPLRWSGAISISKAISDLRSVQAHQAHQSRPIVLKAPAGVFAKEQRFTNCQAAIDYLESLVPAETRSTQVVTRTTLPAQAVASAPVRMQNIVYAK